MSGLADVRAVDFKVTWQEAKREYRVEGFDLDELGVWRIGSLGFPVRVGTLLNAAKAESTHPENSEEGAGWVIDNGFPISRDERERVRQAAVTAWKAAFTPDENGGE